MTNKLTNPVGYLQEFCQRYKAAKFPDYIDLPPVGPDHSREFYCKCIFDGFEVSGKGIQKKQAKSDAAKQMLSFLEEQKYFDKFGISATDGNLPLNEIHPPASLSIKTSIKNPISALQEHCQGNGSSLPIYFESSSMGGFICECSLNGSKTFGEGANKKTAKTEAAIEMCKQLGIIFCGEDVERETQEINASYCDKNAISALQELCAQNKLMPNPIYESKPSFMDQFVVVCNVGTLSAEGRDMTKKGAKLLAANKVLGKIIKQGYETGIKREPIEPRTSASEVDMPDLKPQRHQLLIKPSALENFPLDSSDEEDNNKNKEEDVKPRMNLEELNALASLSLEDTIVEVEPSTVTEQQKAENTTSKNYVVGSESDTCERKDRSSGSHHHESGAMRQLEKKEDNICLLNVSGRVVISSPTSSSSVLDDLQDQKVTLTGVVNKHKERDLKNSLKLDIYNLERKRPTKDGSTQKTPISESLLKWAQNESL